CATHSQIVGWRMLQRTPYWKRSSPDRTRTYGRLPSRGVSMYEKNFHCCLQNHLCANRLCSQLQPGSEGPLLYLLWHLSKPLCAALFLVPECSGGGARRVPRAVGQV